MSLLKLIKKFTLDENDVTKVVTVYQGVDLDNYAIYTASGVQEGVDCGSNAHWQDYYDLEELLKHVKEWL